MLIVQYENDIKETKYLINKKDSEFSADIDKFRNRGN
jgi:hypothetical protein